jgi:4-diphosphocytidyl-2C-methyl-D-erythritol kinase
MSLKSVGKLASCIHGHVVAAALIAAAVLAGGSASGAETLDVVLDRATVLKMPEKVATVVIGNPLIADVSLQPGGIMVVTGKGHGITNVLALDRSGAVLLEKSVQVVGGSKDVLMVYRGAKRESYSCAPNCEKRMTLGDNPEHFGAALGQTMTRSGSAQGAAATK